MDTIFCPNHDNSNESINKEVRFLNELGIKTYDFADFKRCPWRLAFLKAVNLNWYDDINEANHIKARLILLKKICMISFFKLFHVRIIYTLHNRIAHDGKSPVENMILKKFLMRRADTIALLSKKSRDYAVSVIGRKYKKGLFFYVGHPSYENHYCTDQEKHAGMVFLYYGMVRPYKNVELLLSAWKIAGLTDAKLIIAGKPVSEDYKNEIERIVQDVPNVELKLKYIENEQLDQMISGADIIVSPLDKKSSMNSGTLIKAMCMKKTIIIPDIEMTYDYDLENMFAYDYSGREEHLNVLSSKIKEACELYKKDPEIIKKMGEKLYTCFMEKNSDAVYKHRFELMYFGKNGNG